MIAFCAGFGALVLLLSAILDRKHRLAKLVGAIIGIVIVVVASPDGLIFQKLLGRLALPPGIVWSGAVVVTAVQLARRNRPAALRSGAVVVVVTLLGNEWVGQVLMQRLEAPYADDPFAEAPFDAVFVLGGGAADAPHAHYELSASGDRLLLGARLFHAHKTPLLVATGTKIPGFQQQFDNLLATRTIWQELAIPAAAIVVVENTRTTREEAVAAEQLIRERGWRRVGLVTSAWHLRRATRLFTFEALPQVTIVPLAADHRGVPVWEGLYSLVPVGTGAWLQQKALWELLGAAVGR